MLPLPHFGHDWSLLSMEEIQNDFNDMSSSTFTMKLLEEVHVMIYSCTQSNFIVGRTYKKITLFNRILSLKTRQDFCCWFADMKDDNKESLENVLSILEKSRLNKNHRKCKYMPLKKYKGTNENILLLILNQNNLKLTVK